MHLRKILRLVDIDCLTKVYEGGVRAIVIPNGKCRVFQVSSRPGAASTCKHKVPFWESSKHVEFIALDKIENFGSSSSSSTSTIILFRVLPSRHPKAQVHICDGWALGSAEMCKMCVDRIKKMPIARRVIWLTPDANSENQLRPAVPATPTLTASFLRFKHYNEKKHS